MILLADNDVILKLARCDLYSEFFPAFGVTENDLRILITARHVLTSGRIRKRCDDASFLRLKAFLDSVQDIVTSPDENEMIALTEQPRIDTGEVVLFSVCPRIPNSFIATGDKRSLTGLAEASKSHPICSNLYTRLTGRIICFEQIVLRILDHCGFEMVRTRLISGRESDKVLAILLGSGLDASEASVRAGLESYIDNLREESGTLLYES